MKLTNICTNCQLLVGAGKANRAYVIFDYGTPVLALDCSGMKPRYVRLWDGWSITTQRHINKALATLGHDGISKADWYDMPVENAEV